MRLRSILAAAAAALLAVAACGGPKKPAPEKPVKPAVTTTQPEQPKTVAEQFVADCKGEIAAARAILPSIQKASGQRTLDNTLRPLDDL